MTPSTFSRKLVVVIAESALEATLAREVQALGAHGYTVCDARGKGSRGVRDASWEADRNIRMEVICDEATALLIAGALREKYYDHYAMALYVADIAVLRPEKF